ncbi:MAG: lasso RiPP family leader peptide-containing protein [Mesorhizobium sp.]|nr:lasso RiPP family leader peptide-containing protein [Mesorhizobium sp. M1A.F.Ca.IN.022.06.1.1]RUV26608.1 lasso RiPP family leader peptide-containing protein [Mesorhizobium sp. M1A.F.Ca.IN.022.04.1.1]RUV43741.1 lasso RiPP family leader peptide-containing protein [Mesorhizobium sp. M1A.T.Ca.IN.004.03.1.1]RUV61023.1 lasso RiPP family leader peptide-containing protein [Mesorhizobium sp. M1A.F.Ca.IN.022.02.1.1]RUV74900.1 lasso RiPP family leader peptide-containing protein [Mesorhizobium sp. M1A.F
MPADPGSFLRSRKFAEPAMKKTYEKPRLVKKGRLSAVTANGATSLTF